MVNSQTLYLFKLLENTNNHQKPKTSFMDRRKAPCDVCLQKTLRLLFRKKTFFFRRKKVASCKEVKVKNFKNFFKKGLTGFLENTQFRSTSLKTPKLRLLFLVRKSCECRKAASLLTLYLSTKLLGTKQKKASK